MIAPQLARFLEEGLGIYVGTRDDGLRPNGARALAVMVAGGGAELTVHLAAVAADRLLPDLRSNGQVAVSFARPVDDRACQIKGLFVAARPTSDEERAAVERQWQGFLSQLEKIGIPEAATESWVRWPAIAVRVSVTAVFDQTPGPLAGTPLA